MLRNLIVTVSCLLAVGIAQAGEAARIVFVAGDARVAGNSVALGHAVQEGDEIATGADGYIYLKTIDNGFLILRPGSRARIVTYHVDAQNPANTRIKLELLNGVARSISGEAVKQARQNFRFNTPVAAIGVRGTDFTVFTDQETSRVAVVSGGIVVSGFSSTCASEGSGPCEGKTSRELFANQPGQLLQVRKGQVSPQLLPSGSLSPDLSAPSRNDEPGSKTSGSNAQSLLTADISLDPQKNADLLARFRALAQQPVTPNPVPIPAVTTEEPRKIIWGRWQPLLDQPGSIDIVKLVDAKAQLLAINSYFAVLRSQGADWQIPATGTAGFALKQSEAYILDEPARKFSTAKLENGQLLVDFAKASFSTSFDLISQKNERFKFKALGDVSRDGQLLGANQLILPTNMSVSGVVGPENGGSAAYIFQGRVDNQRQATGITYWTKQ